jgi:hypothetical protein
MILIMTFRETKDKEALEINRMVNVSIFGLIDCLQMHKSFIVCLVKIICSDGVMTGYSLSHSSQRQK